MSERKFKIVIWPNDGEDKKISDDFEKMSNRVVQSLHDRRPRVLSELPIEFEAPQKLGEEEYDARIEYPVRVWKVESNALLIKLLNFISTFLNQRADEAGSNFTSSVVLVSKEFFTTKFDAANMNLSVRNFAFLNLVNHSQPLVHYEKVVEDNQQHRDILTRVYGVAQPATIIADFEHDRRQLIVRFPFTEMQYQNRVNKEAEYCVSLTVKYKSVRRILVNLKSGALGEFDLELYFHLSAPPAIRRFKLFEQAKRGTNLLNKPGDRYSVWDKRNKHLHLNEKVNDSPIFRLLIHNVDMETYCSLLNRLSVVTERLLEVRTFLPDRIFRHWVYVQSPLLNDYCKQMCGNNFTLLYMIGALLSRGAVVKDYILDTEENRNEFVEQCRRDFSEDQMITLEVLERVLAEIDERLDGQSPLIIYRRISAHIRRNAEIINQLRAMHSREGYVSVRKVVVTPTRTLFVAPEMLMGNRVLRMDPVRYPLDTFLRVTFRDDDGQQVHANSVGETLIEMFIGKKLENGIDIAGRVFNYFGSSNSQLRDNGCYFIAATMQEISDLQVKLGSFKVQSAPKMMSRLGLCFTQARETGIELDRRAYAIVPDFEGGKDSNDNPYNFSDGVGRISSQTAEQLSAELKLDRCVPSCFQIRFRGFKGVLSVDPSLDRRREWGERHGKKDNTDIAKRDCWLDLMIEFRLSQKKFKTMQDGQKLEIVKYSSPVMLSLNRPVINILDQVSEMQSHASHQRICNRIHLLLDKHLHSLTKSLMDETTAKNKLGEFPKLILYDQISDFNLTKEPFFRSMVRASVRASLKKLRHKLQIPIESSSGRAMFGVADESGQLQYGQVFIKYTKNSAMKLPGKTADRQVLRGPVMITKNPSIVAGDIRMFEAVDIPALHHLCDVVVFPRYGPRPHPDEMAGSDLDGDEYSIMWDEQLYLDHNEDAFDYTSKAQETVATDEEHLRKEMAKFFVDYIKQDSIGQIANAFLVNSDLFGIKSAVCKAIADKHMEAVDFPKTGKPPAPLTKGWSSGADEQYMMNMGFGDGECGVEMACGSTSDNSERPPERPERAPDFMEKNNEPSYISSRLNGQLYRRAKEIDDILSMASVEEEMNSITADPLIYVNGCESEVFMKKAKVDYEAYAANIQSIMDSYGIKTEGELFSGHYTSLRNRISDKDSDDMSFYNTSTAIEQRLFAVFSKFRKQFFEESYNKRYDEVTAPISKFAKVNGVKDVFRRVCHNPSSDCQKLACAYYKFAYDSQTRRLLSFPWLAWDVINSVRRTQAVGSDSEEAKFSFDPLSEKLSKHIEEFMGRRKKFGEKNSFSWIDFKNMLRDNEPNNHPEYERHGWVSVALYCKRYKGLDELMFFCLKWAENNGIFNGAVYHLHVCVLLIQFGLNHLPCESVETVQPWLDLIEPESSESDEVVRLKRHQGGLGKKFMGFMGLLASRQFKTLEFIDFREPQIGYASTFYQKQWMGLHKAALKTYLQIAFTFRFDELLPSLRGTASEQRAHKISQQQEADPFVIEVPSSHGAQVTNNKQLPDRLCHRTGCTNIALRQLPQSANGATVRIIVSSTGDLQSLSNLRSLLVCPSPNLMTNCRQMSTLMAAAVYEKLISEK